jgi:hypothetical protein
MSGDKGYISYTPSDKEYRGSGFTGTQLYEQMKEIVFELKVEWPMTTRFWMYRLFTRYHAKYGIWDKGAKVWQKKLDGFLAKARRCGDIPWESVAEKRGLNDRFTSYGDAEDIADSYIEAISETSLNLQEGQGRRVLVWCEGESYMPRLKPVAKEYGCTLVSGSGFDTVSKKYNFAVSCLVTEHPTTVLHFGDLDGSGEVMCTTGLAEDVQAMVEPYKGGKYNEGADIIFKRIGVLDHHIEQYDLPYEDYKGDVKGSGHKFSGMRETQAEALSSEQAKAILREAIEDNLDVKKVEAMKTATIQARIDALEIMREKLNESKDDD